MSVVSSVISRVSSRPSGWRINVRLSSLMDNIFAIGFGLGLRFVVDTVSNHDFKLTGTLVGLWEGVILLHLLKKTPKSSDPYIGFGVRIFVDLVFTESVARMILVLIWTALGMVLADITPAIWDDVGLKRVWKSFRRDLYTISRMIPTVAFFPPTRTVRFSPSREPSVIADEATELLSPSMVTEQTPIDAVPSAVPRTVLKRRVPGHFPMDFSDTDTDTSSLRAANFVPNGRTSRRLSVYPEIPDYEDSISDLSGSQNDLDEGNLSSEATPTGEPPLTLPDSSEIPEIEEEPLLVDVSAAPVKLEDGETTPTQRHQAYMPPTPSDSAARWGINRDIDEALPIRPPSELLPQIPDFLEEPVSEDWEKIQHADYSEDKPPTPPAKDMPFGLKIPKIPDVPPPVPPVAQQQPQSTTPPDDDMKGWDTMESQILTRDLNINNNIGDDINALPITTNDDTNRQSLPPPYHDYETHEDIYDDPPPHDPVSGVPTRDLLGDDTGVPPVEQDAFTNPQPSLLPPIPMVDSLDPWTSGGGDDFEEQLKRDLEAEQLKAKQDAEEAERKAEEEAQRKAEEEAEEERKKKKAQEKAEREKKEADDALARKKKREEEEAADKAKKEEAEKKKAEELATQKKKEAEEAQARRDALAEEKRKKKEAKEEEKRKKAEEAERKKAEEAERKKAEEAEAARVKAEKEAARVEAERLRAEEEARVKAEEEEARLKAEEAAKLKAEEEEREAARLKAEEEEREAEKKAEDAREAEEQARKQKELEDSAKLEEPPTATADETSPQDQVEQDNSQPDPEPETSATQVSPPEETTEDAKTPTPVERPLEDDSQQLPSPAEPPHPPPSEAADTVSEASEAPPSVPYDRAARMLSLRAQMVETEATLAKLKDSGADSSSPEVKALEKVLRKMHRQAERRYAAGMLLNKEQESDSISLGNLNDNKTEEKIAEKIEQLLSPTAQSLYLKINLPTTKPVQQRIQKGVIGRLTEELYLDGYCREQGKKTVIIQVAESQFSEWLTGYRKLSTRADKDNEYTSLWG